MGDEGDVRIVCLLLHHEGIMNHQVWLMYNAVAFM